MYLHVYVTLPQKISIQDLDRKCKHPPSIQYLPTNGLDETSREEATSTNLPFLLLPERECQLLLLWLSVNTGFKLLVPFKGDYMPTTLHTYSVTDWDC